MRRNLDYSDIVVRYERGESTLIIARMYSCSCES